jgi:hypothetical protein
VKPGFDKRWVGQPGMILIPETWMTIAVAAATIIGFSIRAAYVLKGYSAFNSDEVLYYHVFRDMDTIKPGLSDYIDPFHFYPGVRFLFFKFFYFLAGHRLEYMPFFACLTNVFLYLLWMHVLVQRTGSFWSSFPLLVFLMFPSPSVSYLGANLSEIRMCYFYGAILTLFAGGWFKNPWKCIAFGLVASWGCWEDLFTVFFVLPVIWYEKETLFSGRWINRIFRFGWVCLGTVWIPWVHPEKSLWMSELKTGYLNPGMGPVSEWVSHIRILITAWPVYWIGGIPCGYLQNSQLGRWLNPSLDPSHWFLAPYLFWPLLGTTFLASLAFFRSSTRLSEMGLWWTPSILFILFFIFGRQAWDALTLRYLGFWQLAPAIFLGLWMISLRSRLESIFFYFILISWFFLNSFFLVLGIERTPLEHPAQRIAFRLEQEGYQAGFSSYWVSEPVCYFSEDRVLLAPYDHSPISRKVTFASQNKEKIALVWVEGLDHPNILEKVVRQIESLGYHLISKSVFKEEGWSIMGWEKSSAKIGKESNDNAYPNSTC